MILNCVALPTGPMSVPKAGSLSVLVVAEPAAATRTKAVSLFCIHHNANKDVLFNPRGFFCDILFFILSNILIIHV